MLEIKRKIIINNYLKLIKMQFIKIKLNNKNVFLQIAINKF